jgi:DNA polymerase-3 subunit alpha
MENAQRMQRDALSGQSGLFADVFGAEPHPDPPLPNIPDWTDREKLQYEKELLGFYVTGHPLNEYLDKISELATHDSESLEGLEKGKDVVVCGIITGIQRRRNKEGKLWASFQLEDLKGRIDAMVFTTKYEECLSALTEDSPVMIRASALPEEGNPTKISVQSIVPLAVARLNLPSLISITVRINGASSGGRADDLRILFTRKPGDTEVRLRLEKPRDFSVILDVASRVRPDKEFLSEVARICGSEAVEVLAN